MRAALGGTASRVRSRHDEGASSGSHVTSRRPLFCAWRCGNPGSCALPRGRARTSPFSRCACIIAIGSEYCCSAASETWNFFSAPLISAACGREACVHGGRRARMEAPRQPSWSTAQGTEGERHARCSGAPGARAERACAVAATAAQAHSVRILGCGLDGVAATRPLRSARQKESADQRSRERTFLRLLHPVPRKELVDPAETQLSAVQFVVRRRPARRSSMPYAAHPDWHRRAGDFYRTKKIFQKVHGFN